MVMRNLVLVLFLSCQVGGSAWACAKWATVQKKIRSTWAKDRPGYKILRIKRGALRRYTNKVRQGRRVVTRQFCAQSVKVEVKRDNGTQATFGSSWHYQKLGGRWVFHHQAMGTVDEKASATNPPPPKAKVKKMIAAAWVREVGKTDKVTKVLMTKLKKATRVILYSSLVDVYINEKDGKKVVCKDYKIELYKGKKVEGISTQLGTGKGPWEVTFGQQSKYRSRCKPQ